MLSCSDLSHASFHPRRCPGGVEAATRIGQGVPISALAVVMVTVFEQLPFAPRNTNSPYNYNFALSYRVSYISLHFSESSTFWVLNHGSYTRYVRPSVPFLCCFVSYYSYGGNTQTTFTRVAVLQTSSFPPSCHTLCSDIALVIVKHQGKKYEVEADPSSNGETFKFQLFSLTGVEPDRQKILVKGGQLKDDADMSKLGLKPNQVIMMMGTPSGASNVIERPKEPIKFLEDMTEAEAAQQEGATPAGLQNLGNTCYMNATLQTLRAIPELQQELSRYSGG